MELSNAVCTTTVTLYSSLTRLVTRVMGECFSEIPSGRPLSPSIGNVWMSQVEFHNYCPYHVIMSNLLCQMKSTKVLKLWKPRRTLSYTLHFALVFYVSHFTLRLYFVFCVMLCAFLY